MQLHAGARGLGGDGCRLQAQPFRPGDVDGHVLAASGEDRVVERLISRRLTHPAVGKMLGHQRRQDAHHHDVRAVLVGLDLGGVEAAPDLLLEVQRGPAGQRARGNVEFDVVGAQFGLIRRIGDGCEHLLVGHRGLVLVVDEVAFDLHAGERTLELEARLSEHGLEHVEAQLHLAPILLAVHAAELGVLDLFTHTPMQQCWARSAQPNAHIRRIAG